MPTPTHNPEVCTHALYTSVPANASTYPQGVHTRSEHTHIPPCQYEHTFPGVHTGSAHTQVCPCSLSQTVTERQRRRKKDAMDTKVLGRFPSLPRERPLMWSCHHSPFRLHPPSSHRDQEDAHCTELWWAWTEDGRSSRQGAEHGAYGVLLSAVADIIKQETDTASAENVTCWETETCDLGACEGLRTNQQTKRFCLFFKHHSLFFLFFHALPWVSFSLISK